MYTHAHVNCQSSSTYWEGNNQAETLQRVYGISFPDSKQLKEWKHFQEEAAKRDHRKLGRVSACLLGSLSLLIMLCSSWTGPRALFLS